MWAREGVKLLQEFPRPYLKDTADPDKPFNGNTTIAALNATVLPLTYSKLICKILPGNAL